MQKPKFVKSVPLFFNLSPPHSKVVKTLLREILREPPEPLTAEEIKKLKQQRKGRKRVYLTEKDKDLQDFFLFAPLSFQYAVFKELNKKLLQEVEP
jgi:hypothetical protein